MRRVFHLTSKRKKHLKTHYALRGSDMPVRDGSPSWWLVYDDIDHPPELVGAESFLPKHAYDELQRLRKEPKVGSRRAARYIDASMTFFPGDEHNGIPHNQNVDWLDQFPRTGSYSVDRAYLVRLAYPSNEDSAFEVWESLADPKHPDPNHLDAPYRLVWKEKPDKD